MPSPLVVTPPDSPYASIAVSNVDVVNAVAPAKLAISLVATAPKSNDAVAVIDVTVGVASAANTDAPSPDNCIVPTRPFKSERSISTISLLAPTKKLATVSIGIAPPVVITITSSTPLPLPKVIASIPKPPVIEAKPAPVVIVSAAVPVATIGEYL